MEHSSNQRLPLPSFQELKDSVAGSWGYILSDLAPELADALAKAPNHVACPVHGGRDGFRMYRDYQQTGGGVCNTCGPFPSGFHILTWLRQYSMKDATRDVGKWHRGESGAVDRRPPPPPPPPVDTEKNYERIRSVWLSSFPIKGTPAERYLLKRGILKEDIPSTLRFHPSLTFYDQETDKSLGRFPCLVAPILDANGQMISVHRIYLTSKGDKADLPEVKKMMGRAGELRGTAIKLQPLADSKVLGLAEGIETALAAHAISRMPVWSCVSSRLLEAVAVPKEVELVVIWADLDRSKGGQEAAQRLKERLEHEGKKVQICLPDGPIPENAKGVDWLDILNEKGIAGFPSEWQCWKPQDPLAA